MSTAWEDALRGAGLRVTRQRLAVLDVLETLPHAEADDIVRRVRELEPRGDAPRAGALAATAASDGDDETTGPSATAGTEPTGTEPTGLAGTSAQTVYGVLSALEASGLIRRIELPGSNWRYETRVADNHHHLVCRSCGRVEDVECVVGHAPCLHPADTHGFAIDTADVVFMGLCADCAAEATIEASA